MVENAEMPALTHAPSRAPVKTARTRRGNATVFTFRTAAGPIFDTLADGVGEVGPPALATVDNGCSQPMRQPISEIALHRTYSKRAPKPVGT